MANEENTSLDQDKPIEEKDAVTVLPLAATIQGSGSLKKDGAGTVNLTATDSTYGGATTINAGVLQASADKALGKTSSLTIVKPAKLLVSANVALTLTTLTTDTGSFIEIEDQKTLTLTVNNKS